MQISKRLFTFIIAVLLLLIGGATYYISELKADSESWASAHTAATERAKFWENKDGLSQGEVRTAYASVDVIRQEHSAEIEKVFNSAYEQGLKKNLKNLQSVTTVASSTTTEVKTALRDTVFVNGESGRSFTYSDKWTSASGYFLRDSTSFHIKTLDSLSIVQFWKKPGSAPSKWFRRSELYTDVVNYNPNSTLTGIKSTVVRPPGKSRVGIVAFAGADISLRPTVGVGIGYTLISF